MCYTDYQHQAYRAPTNNIRRSVPNTYWRLIFGVGHGIQRAVITSYNVGNIYMNFMSQSQIALDPYNISIKSITLKIPPSFNNEKTSEMVIRDQKDFLRALNLIPTVDDLYNPLRGIEAYVNKDEDVMSPTDSGYSSEKSNGYI